MTLALNLFSQGIDPGLVITTSTDRPHGRALQPTPRPSAHPYAGELAPIRRFGLHQAWRSRTGLEALAKRNDTLWEVP